MYQCSATLKHRLTVVALATCFALPVIGTIWKTVTNHHARQVAQGLVPEIVITVPQGTPEYLTFSEEGTFLEIGTNENRSFVFQTLTGAYVPTQKPFALKTGSFTNPTGFPPSPKQIGGFSESLAISENQRTVAVPTNLYWDHSWKLLDAKGAATYETSKDLALRDVMLSPQGRYLIGWGEKILPSQGRGQTMYYLIDSHSKTPSVGEGLARESVLAFSPDERTLLCASAGFGKSVLECYDPATRKRLWVRELPATFHVPLALTVSPDSSLVALADRNGLLVWDAHTGALLRTLTRQVSRQEGVRIRFSPNNRWLADLTDTGAALWDWQRGK